MKKRKECRFIRYSRRLLITISVVFVFGMTYMNSYEATMNIQIKKISQQIEQVQADLDGLDMKLAELSSFTRLETIAKKKQLTYSPYQKSFAVVSVRE